jgi:hypothetical protein
VFFEVVRFPGCIDASTAEIGTPHPELPTYPRNNVTCTEQAYQSYVETNLEQYEFVQNLTNGAILH